jgi:hypothetical protein
MKASSIGMMIVADAEGMHAKGELEIAYGKFQEAINMFENCFMGRLFYGLSLYWFGRVLLADGKRVEANNRFISAVGIFQSLGNEHQVQKTTEYLLK